MYIKSIELKNVRGVRHLKTSQLPETGVIVIHGDNEAGKSTIMDAVKICLTQPHSSKAAKAKKGEWANFGAAWLKPVHTDEAPEVTVELVIGNYDLKIFKRFIKKPAAQLTINAPTHETLTGESADKELLRILGENVDTNLLATLFMDQEDLGGAIAAAGLPALTGALERSSGVASPSKMDEGHGELADNTAEETALMRAVQDEFHKYFTGKNRKPTGAYAQAQQRVVTAQQSLAQAKLAHQELEDYVGRYERAERDIAQALADLPIKREAVEEKRVAAEASAKVQQQFEELQLGLHRAQSDVARALEDQERRQAAKEEHSQALAQLEEIKPQLKLARDRAEAEQAQLEAAVEELEQAKLQRAHAREVATQSQKAQTAVELRDEVERLRVRVEELQSLSSAVVKAKEDIARAGRLISDTDVSRVEKAHNEYQLASTLREQATAKLFITAKEATVVYVDDAETSIDSDGEVQVLLRDGMELGIGDITARYAAGVGTGEQAVNREEEAEQALKVLLLDLDCEDLGQVRSRRDAHKALQEALNRAQADLSVALRGDDLEQLSSQLKAKEELAEENGELLAAWSRSEEKIDAASAQELLQKWADQVDQAQAKVDPLRDKKAQLELTRLRQMYDHAQAAVRRTDAALADMRLKVSDDTISQRYAKAQEIVVEQRERVESAEKDLVDLDAPLAAQLYDYAQEGLRSVEKRLEDAKRRKWSMESYISSAEGAAEALLLADAELKAASASLDNVERRAMAAQRLLDVMERHRDAARQRYAAPFADALTKLARTMYGSDIAFDLNEELEVTSRTRGGATVALSDLSGGAKEQLAIMTRFAIAQLVGSSPVHDDQAAQQAVPIMVDDALGSTDSRRLELMSILFGQAGVNSQIIVLTCMPERYEAIPGRTVLDIEELKV